MPIYEYTCQSCEKLSDVLQKVSDPAPEACPQCGAEGTLSKVVSRSSFVLKGGGWYSDLYSSTKKDGGGKDSSAPAATTSSTSTSTSASSATSSATPAPSPPAASTEKK